MTSDPVSPRKRDNEPGRQLSPEQAAAAAMVAEAKARGLALTGPDGLLKLFTKNVLETALNEEMTEHLGYERHDADPTGHDRVTRYRQRPAGPPRQGRRVMVLRDGALPSPSPLSDQEVVAVSCRLTGPERRQETVCCIST